MPACLLEAREQYRIIFMPINPNERERRAYPTDRRSASAKRQDSVTKSEHPIVTQAVYEAIIRGKDTESNLKTKRLCQGRNLAGRLMLALDGSLKDHNPQIETQPTGTYNKLRQLRTMAERIYAQFPLRIENK